MRLIDADKLIEHLNDYAYQLSPILDGDDDSAYQAVMNCIAAAENAETVRALKLMTREEFEKHGWKGLPNEELGG